MNFIKTILILLFSFPVLAQTEMEKVFLSEKEKLIQELQQFQSYINQDKSNLEKEVARLKEVKDRKEYLEKYEKEFAESKRRALSELSEMRGRFFRCLRRELQERNFLNYDYCAGRYKKRLSPEQNQKVNYWKMSLNLPLNTVATEKSTLSPVIVNTAKRVDDYDKRLKQTLAREETIKSSIKLQEDKIQETKLLPGNDKFLKCNSQTPIINLEEEVPFKDASFKGPFHGVPRDNQDGLGTCYANTAKNLLVGVSGGEDVASFLDLSLVYKKSTGELKDQGLDAGNSCSTLNAAKKEGYCPQHFSALETGERNETGENLFNQDKYSYLATNVNILRDFIQGLSEFESGNSPVKDEILSKSMDMIKVLKENPDITLPLPVVRHPVVADWKVSEAYHIKKINSVTEEVFVKEHQDRYETFYPLYIKAVLDGKSMDEIFGSYKMHMSPFISKYGLESSLEEFKRVFKFKADPELNDPDLKKKLRSSVDFLKFSLNKNEMSDGDFFEYCATNGAKSLSFLSSMQALVDKIRENKVNEEKLFDANGRFKSADELMQLTVAPSCLNKENRKALPNFTCDNGYNTISMIKTSGKSYNDQVKMLRERVVLSLIQGYPLGNSFPTTKTTSHINTIVGLRFNPGNQSCEYLIRESQNGQSLWQSEQQIFSKIQGLAEVRKQP